MATERTVLLVDGLPQQDVCTVSAQAEVSARQQHHRLGAVLTDDTLLPVLLLLQQSQQVLSRQEFVAFACRRRLLQWPVCAGGGEN